MPGRSYQQILIQTKLNRPVIGSNSVARPRLISLLDEGMKGWVTLISAPAEYSKTTLAVQWLDQITGNSAWLSLDKHDNESDRFLKYGIAAVPFIFLDFGPV